ncbi:FMN-binding protein, partial [Anaerotruncus massiliensis (ex Liu et al. 2021)]|uniref:FMN-binding protein n=2 Tax=Oscillospiraceae TaxID=216572 RepID=UPI003A88358F
LIAAKDDSGNGYAFKVKDKGFGGVYNVMVGIGNDGRITGVKLLDNSETPGLGSKTGADAFTGQFPGKDKSLEGVDAVTGATISSKAFFRCVDTAYQAYEAVGEGA